MVKNIRVIHVSVSCIQHQRLVMAVLSLDIIMKCRMRHKSRLKLWKVNTVDGIKKCQTGVMKDAGKVNEGKEIEEKWTVIKEVWLHEECKRSLWLFNRRHISHVDVVLE